MAKKGILDFSNESALSRFSFQNVSEAIFWINLEGEIIYANDSASKMTGYSKKELTSMQVTDVNF